MTAKQEGASRPLTERQQCKSKGSHSETSPQTGRENPFSQHVLQFCSIEEFVGLNNEPVSTDCMDVLDKVITQVTDEQARELIRKVAKCGSVSEFQELEITKRNKYLKKLREKGVSIRQLSRLTGVSFNVIRNV